MSPRVETPPRHIGRTPAVLLVAALVSLASGEAGAATRPGDANCDAAIDAADLVAATAAVGTATSECASADATGDARFDDADVAVTRARIFGRGRRDPNPASWPMHVVDGHFRGANALGATDLNRDGFTDYVTNYEFDQRYVIELHPGVADVRKPWPTIVTFLLPPSPVGTDTEHAAVADFDGDGNLDVVGAQGWHRTAFWEGQAPGVRLIWGPTLPEIFTEAAWLDAGRIPATVDRGHFLYVVPLDVNGDGATDILAGGRIQENNGAKASLKWIEAPFPRADRRDLSRWQVHEIDPEQLDGHGFVLTDVDEDGDLDIADANADFDTPEDEETVHWYENPGTGSPAQRQPWTRHELFRGPDFYAKPGVVAADLDGDGDEDLVTQTRDEVYFFRKTSIAPVEFELVLIPKPRVAQWLARPIRVADIDGDGRVDLFAMVTHDRGDVPPEKYAAFWMRYEGDTPRADNWSTHLVKWGAGKPMLLEAFGEKWDQVQIDDVDRDGDLDVLANCEEWWVDEAEVLNFSDPRVQPTSVGVVWFENRLYEDSPLCREQSAGCVLEAEHFSDLLDSSWVKHGRYADYTGDGYVQAAHSATETPREAAASQGYEYRARLDGGRYHLWLRRWIPRRWGRTGGARSNSAWVALDDAPFAVFDDSDAASDEWAWVRSSAAFDLAPGVHTLRLRAREGGYAIDRLLLTRDAHLTPTGAGPNETP